MIFLANALTATLGQVLEPPMRRTRFGGIAAPVGFANYAAYATYVNSLSVNKAVADTFVSQFGAYGSPIGLCRWSSSDGATTSGDMFGSPWAANRAVRYGSSHVSRILRHSIENTGSLAAAANVVLIQSTAYTGAFDATTRNGYTSIGSGSTTGLTVDWVVYWDTLLGKARKFDAVTKTWTDWTQL